MLDPELLKLTASEPLTLDQEYDMQETWRNDEDSAFLYYYRQISLSFSICPKLNDLFFFAECTFLVLNKDLYERTQDEIGSI